MEITHISSVELRCQMLRIKNHSGLGPLPNPKHFECYEENQCLYSTIPLNTNFKANLEKMGLYPLLTENTPSYNKY